jgi:hypothetical protein
MTGGCAASGLALLLEIRRPRIAGGRRHLRTPGGQEGAHLGLVRFVAQRRNIGNPHIQLKGPAAVTADLLTPGCDFFRRHEQHAAGPKAASVRDRNRQLRCGCACHRREQNRSFESETRAETFDTFARAHHRSLPFTSCYPSRPPHAKRFWRHVE